jgi:branched-subunit amino acid transport protein AzlD
MIWAAIFTTWLGCYALKLAGLSVPERVLDHPRMKQLAALLPVALLASLVVIQTFAEREHLVVDARAAGVAMGVIAVLLRAPFLVVLAVAAGTAALLRTI